MSEPIRILHVLNGLGTGGAEAIIMNWYRNIDRTKVQFDFLIRSDVNMFEEEIKELGGRVYITPGYPRHYIANKRATKHFFDEHASEYAGIHVHGNALLYVNIFDIAKKHGIDLRIFHSHSTSTSLKYRWLHILNRYRIKRLATDFLACSDAAGKWAFADNQYILVKNGVNTEQLSYNASVREEVRNSLQLPNDAVVYGHVGRFVPVKNHMFLIEVFEKIVATNDKARLLLIGEGPLFDDVKRVAKEKNIYEKIIFAGRQKNIPAFMNAMDIFLLPSLFEGLVIVAIEAQASGLPCILSGAVTKEVKLTDLVDFLPLTDIDAWVKRSTELNGMERKNTQAEIAKAGYDIKHSTKILEEYYCSRR